MRYVVIGAGAVGGTIGGRLFQHGNEVTLVARGAHGAALRDNGLRLRSPDDDVVLPIPTVTDPADVAWRDDDVVIIATKTQDSAAVLDAVAAVAPASLAIVCAQNGLENERNALRRFRAVHGMCVMLPAAHLEPGVVAAYSAPITGLLDVGLAVGGTDAVDEAVAADLTSSRLDSHPDPDIMRTKRAKLLMNLGNALEAACGPAARGHELYGAAKAEALACFAAAGLDAASDEEDAARRGDLLRMQPIAGERRGGGSTWQSLARGTGATEVDYLNGEIVLLGRQYGVPTPVNAMLQRVVRRLAATGAPPESLSPDELAAYSTTIDDTSSSGSG